MPVPHLVLYSRSYCHLCEDMLLALQSNFPAAMYQLAVKDVDQDPAAVALYDELVPVLVAQVADGSEMQLCHYFLDVGRVTEFLATFKK